MPAYGKTGAEDQPAELSRRRGARCTAQPHPALCARRGTDDDIRRRYHALRPDPRAPKRHWIHTRRTSFPAPSLEVILAQQLLTHYRVSSQRQRASGLGLEAQPAAVMTRLAGDPRTVTEGSWRSKQARPSETPSAASDTWTLPQDEGHLAECESGPSRPQNFLCAGVD